MAPLFATRDRLRTLLVGTTHHERVEMLSGLLGSSEPESVYAAILLVRELGPEAATPLAGQLVGLLTSELQVLCANSGTGSHESVAIAASQALGKLNIALPEDAIQSVLGNADLSITLPEACYDQGAYIGDYATFTFRPAELARKLLAKRAGAAR